MPGAPQDALAEEQELMAYMKAQKEEKVRLEKEAKAAKKASEEAYRS
jgi:hypothetical protein